MLIGSLPPSIKVLITTSRPVRSRGCVYIRRGAQGYKSGTSCIHLLLVLSIIDAVLREYHENRSATTSSNMHTQHGLVRARSLQLPVQSNSEQCRKRRSLRTLLELRQRRGKHFFRCSRADHWLGWLRTLTQRTNARL